MVNNTILVTLEIVDKFKKTVAYDCKDLEEDTIKKAIDKCGYALYNYVLNKS